MQNLSSSPRQVLSTILFIVLFVACLQIIASPVTAATGINNKINFQGKLTNANGTNVADNTYTVVFSLYDASSAGTQLWTETQSVTTVDGVFRVSLGSSTTLPGSVDFNTDNIYLGIKVGADAEMTPRIQFTAVPYAFNASKVAGLTVTDTTGTLTIPNAKTIQFADAFTTSGANPLTLTTTSSTNVTLPTTGTLATLAGAETLSSKTLTAPKFADGGFLADASGNELLVLDSNASAVNEITLANAATGSGVSFTATGGDSNVAFSILSKAAGALTLDSGTTGTVNIGTGNNAKTIAIGTGTAGNTINIGTDNTVSDTINIGSALDNVAITGDDWSITSAGVLTVASCSGCGGGGGANTALSNLASVAINTTLVSDTDVTDDLGTSSIQWRKLYVGGDQTTSTYGIQFGATNPANLYRSGADTLKTDDAFNVGGNVNITAAGVISGVTGFTEASGAFAFSGGGNFSVDSAAFDVTTGGAVSGVTGYTQGSGTMSVTTNATTGTGSSSGMYLNADTVTSGNGLYINAAGLIANGSAQYINGTSAVTSGTTIGSTNVLSVTNSGSSSGSFLGLRGQSYVNNSAALTGVAAGLEGVAQNANTQTVSHARGVQGFVNQSNASGTITNGRAFFAQIQNTTGTIATGTGLYVADASAAGTLTTQYGVYIDALTKGGTNVALCFDCDGTWTASTVAAGIQFGSDANAVNLYRSASDTLRTDDALSINGTATISSAGAISGVTGYTQSTGAFAFSGGGNFSLDSAGLDVTTGGALTGVASIDTITVSATAMTFAGAGTINSTGANALTLDSTSTGTVNLGTSNNAKTIAIGTGTAGNTINIGTNNTTKDTIGIGSALDDVAITGDDWSITNAGVLTVVSCTGCAGAAGANTALSNLASVAINTTLVSDTDVTDDLGTSAINWKKLYIGGNQTTNTYGIQFGPDASNPANLYRSAADTLKTDDAFNVGGNFNVTAAGVLTGITGYTQSSGTFAFTNSSSTGNAFSITGPTGSVATNNHFVNLAADTGNSFGVLGITTDYSGSSTSGYGIYNAGTDSTVNTNTDYGYYGTITASGVATGKTVYGVYQNITTSGTNADTLYSGYFTQTNTAGGISSGTRNQYGVYSTPANTAQNTGGTTNIYGFYGSPSYAAGANSSGSTQNIYGAYLTTTGTLVTGGTINQYGLYIADGSSSTTGTSAKYGLYIAPQTAATNNYGICFDCDGTWNSSTVASGLQFGTDANAVTLYRSASDTLRTGDGLTVDLDLIVSGGDVTGANSAAIDIGEATSGSITLSGPATGTSAGFVRVPVKTDAGDPTTTQTNGAIYYNSNSNKFRCYEASAWANCIGSGGTPTWNSITDPTGTQTLAFGDAELNAWTISSDTETFWTMTADSLTTGKLYDISLDGLTTGVGINMQSTSTALTTGNLMNLEWAPAGSITSTSDLFVMNIGSGDLANTFINLKDNGSSVLSVSQTQFTTSLPTNFSASGDVSIAYDIAFTNPTASYITSLAPITIRSGESFNSSDLTLQTYNYGNIIFATSDNGIMRIPVKSTTGDPTNNAEGNMYYNDFDNKFRCYQGSAWTDCIGSGGSTTLQQAYDAGTPTILTDASGDIIFQVIGGATDTQFKVSAASAPEVDMTSITNAGFGTSTDGVDGLSINFVQADDAAGTDTNAGLNVGITAASDDAGDILSAISISVTSPTANNRERGISIGSGFDEDIYFASASAQVRMQDGGEIEFTDGSMGGAANNDLPLARLKEYFAGANYGTFEAQGFINIDGSFFMENFISNRVVQTADQTNQTGRFGDNSMWSLDELGAGGTASNATMGCSVLQNNVATQSTYNVNGVLEISYETSSNTNGTNLTGPACQVYLGASTLTGTNLPANAFLQAANKFVVYYKFRPGAQYTNTATNKYMWFGVNNHTAPWQGAPTVTHTNKGGMWISNVTSTGSNAAADTVWSGVVQYGTNRTTVGCTSANITTNAYALARIEARATNDVHFFLDSDVSNGVALSECGAGVTSNIPTVQMRPAINAGNFTSFTSTAALWTVYVDLFAYVQDDPRDLGAPAAGMTQENEAKAPVFNPINGADLAEHYIFSTEDQVEAGDVVSLGETAGEGDKVSRPYDRKLLGVIAESPGLVLGESAPDSLPVAISGRVPVKVTAKNGAIKVGDPITSSDIPGVAIRATAAGKILGTAMEAFDGSSCSSEGTDSGQARMMGTTQCVGKILVSINPGYYINDGQDLAIIENQPEMSLGATGSGTLKPTQGVAVQAEAQDGGFVSDPSVAQQIVSNLVIFNNGLRVDKVFESLGDAVFYGKTRFEGAVEYVASVVFKSDVEFEKEVVFNSDTAGYAVIKKGQRFVDVGFEQEYKNQPVIQVSPSIFKLTETTFKDMIAQDFCTELEGIEVCQDKLVSTILDSDLNYAVQNQTTQGFLIVLDREAPVDMTFSWQAAAVKNVKTAVNNGPAGLVRPFKGDYEVSNKFGEHSLNPAIQEKDAKVGLLGHDGFDIAVPMKTPIVAVDDGIVASRNSDYGKTLVLKHEWGETLYGHLSDIKVEVGQKVTKGQEVALSGNTGLTTGPHLHFGMKLNNSKDDNGYRGFVNPNLYIAFEKHRAASAVAGASTRLDSADPRKTSLETQISASSSSILHKEEERVVSSSSASVSAEGNTTKILEKGGNQ